MCRSCDWFKQRRLLGASGVTSKKRSRRAPKKPQRSSRAPKRPPKAPELRAARRTRRRPGQGSATPSRGRAHTTSGLVAERRSRNGESQKRALCRSLQRAAVEARARELNVLRPGGHKQRALMLSGFRDTGFALAAEPYYYHYDYDQHDYYQ